MDGPNSVAVADLDGDGDLDLVSANFMSEDLTLFLQSAPGLFDPTPLVLHDGPGITSAPIAVTAADLDGDGDQDLAVAHIDPDGVSVYFQTAPGVFDPNALLIGSSTMRFPRSISAADLDGDGDTDLVTANKDSNNLTLFFQSVPGGFHPAPMILGGSGLTDRPYAVTSADVDGDGLMM